MHIGALSRLPDDLSLKNHFESFLSDAVRFTGMFIKSN